MENTIPVTPNDLIVASASLCNGFLPLVLGLFFGITLVSFFARTIRQASRFSDVTAPRFDFALKEKPKNRPPESPDDSPGEGAAELPIEAMFFKVGDDGELVPVKKKNNDN